MSELIRDVAPVKDGILTPYSDYFRSLTTPECSEVTFFIRLSIRFSKYYKQTFQIVHCINFLQPLQISESQLAIFRQFSDPHGENMSDNFRPIQPLNNRKVVIFGPTT